MTVAINRVKQHLSRPEARTTKTMRVSKEKAAENRERILVAAAQMFRERGLAVGVDDVAAAAGLTHGSVYSQFGSKERLAAEALNHAIAGSAVKFAKVESLADYADRYLSMVHRDRPGDGCVVAALGCDVPRAGDATRKTFTDGVRRMVERLSRVGRKKGRPQAEDDALAAAAMLVGGIILARAVDDPDLSRRILASCRAALGAEG